MSSHFSNLGGFTCNSWLKVLGRWDLVTILNGFYQIALIDFLSFVGMKSQSTHLYMKSTCWICSFLNTFFSWLIFTVACNKIFKIIFLHVGCCPCGTKCFSVLYKMRFDRFYLENTNLQKPSSKLPTLLKENKYLCRKKRVFTVFTNLGTVHYAPLICLKYEAPL